MFQIHVNEREAKKGIKGKVGAKKREREREKEIRCALNEYGRIRRSAFFSFFLSTIHCISYGLLEILVF